MLKIAITGNIAAGKSQVEKIISSYYPVYDADKIAHKYLGNVDRKELGKKVFADLELRRRLEEEIHPKVKNEISDILQKDGKMVFVSVPLLFETGFNKLFDKIILVVCDEKTRLKRLMNRNDLTEEEAQSRINSQMKQEDKIKKSDFIIDNNSGLEQLEEQVLVLIRKLESLI